MQKCNFDDLEQKLILDLNLSLNPSNSDDEEVEDGGEEEIDIIYKKRIEENLNLMQDETRSKLSNLILSPDYNSCFEKRKNVSKKKFRKKTNEIIGVVSAT